MSILSLTEFPKYRTLTGQLQVIKRAAPELVSVSSIGETPEERSLWCVTVAANRTEKKDTRRPALLITANMHAPELAGSWVCLRLLEHLVERYGDDETVTRLLEERTFYVMPRIAVDGAEYVLETRRWNVRSRRVPLEKNDIGPDVILPEDLTGDGRILTMRWPSMEGEKRLLENDDRVVVTRGDDEIAGQFYQTAVEGTIPDYRGGPVTEPNTRNDFNRNFPSEGWRPFDWIGHGQYPLSEPETRALAEFLYNHQNVVGVVDLHTGNPAIFYPPVTSDADYDDSDLVERIGNRGEEITDFPLLSGYKEAQTGERCAELPGSFKDFAYERTGALAYLVELGMCYNSLGIETEDLAMDASDHEAAWGRRLIEWHDEHPEAGLFHEWEPIEHPQLGEVEVGGWDRVRFTNPPLKQMDSVADRTVEFLLTFAEQAPSVRVKSTRVESLGSDLRRVTATVVNHGSLSTNVTERGRKTIQDQPPTVELLGDVEFVTGERTMEIEHLPAQTGRQTLEWVVRSSTPVDKGTREGGITEVPEKALMGVEVTGARGIFDRQWIHGCPELSDNWS